MEKKVFQKASKIEKSTEIIHVNLDKNLAIHKFSEFPEGQRSGRWVTPLFPSLKMLIFQVL